MALLALWVAAAAFILINWEPDQTAVVEPTPSGAVVAGDGSDTDAVADCEIRGTCDDPVTRAEVAGMLVAMLELPETSDDFFVDDQGSEHEDAINRLAAAGVTRGCGAGMSDEYCPEDLMRRDQLATFLSRALELPPTDTDHFDDDNGTYHEESINRAAAASVVRGCGEREYCPLDPVTRGELMALSERLLEGAASPS